MRPIFNIFFLNKVVVGSVNSAWTVTLSPKAETRAGGKKKEKRKKKETWND